MAENIEEEIAQQSASIEQKEYTHDDVLAKLQDDLAMSEEAEDPDQTINGEKIADWEKEMNEPIRTAIKELKNGNTQPARDLYDKYIANFTRAMERNAGQPAEYDREAHLKKLEALRKALE
ncbi:MAG: hypothetical protein PHN19_00490 [Patescibacteria group bacterium]|nr:hypothetical protein [Patescibacteria group bacterium]